MTAAAPQDSVALHPRKARHLALALLRCGTRLTVDGARAQAALGRSGEDARLAGPLLDAAAWATAQAQRVMVISARVEAWEAEGRLPPGVVRWDHPWDAGFADPAASHTAAQAALAAWHDGDLDTFVRVSELHAGDAVFAATVLATVDAAAIAGRVGDRWVGLAAVAPAAGDRATTGVLGTLLATASRVGLAPAPGVLAAALAREGVPAAALGLLMTEGTFDTAWLVQLGLVVLPAAGAGIVAGGEGDRLGAGTAAGDLLPPRWAGDLRVPVLEAIAADPVAAARLLAVAPLGFLLPAAAEVPAAGRAVADLLDAAASAPRPERAAAAAAVIGALGSPTAVDRPAHDEVLVAAVALVAPHLDALRPPGFVGGGFPPPTLAVDPLDAGRFVAAVARRDASAAVLVDATNEWLSAQVPLATALPASVLPLRMLGATAGSISSAVEAGRCDRADRVDDTREKVATMSSYLAAIVTAFAPTARVSISTSFRAMWFTGWLDGNRDYTTECYVGEQDAEATRTVGLGLAVLDATWANRGANRLFTTEGGPVPPPPEAVLDGTGDRFRPELDGDALRALGAWMSQPAVAEGLRGVDAFTAAFASAAVPG